MRRPEFQLVAWTLSFYLRVDTSVPQSNPNLAAKSGPGSPVRTRGNEKKR